MEKVSRAVAGLKLTQNAFQVSNAQQRSDENYKDSERQAVCYRRRHTQCGHPYAKASSAPSVSILQLRKEAGL